MKFVKNPNAHNENGGLDYTACFYYNTRITNMNFVYKHTHGCYSSFL